MTFAHKPHFVQGAQYHLAPDAQQTPPIPCAFKLGDKVIFTNDYGISFPDLRVTGFSSTPDAVGRFIYLDTSCWWFPVKPESLQLQPNPPQ